MNDAPDCDLIQLAVAWADRVLKREPLRDELRPALVAELVNLLAHLQQANALKDLTEPTLLATVQFWVDMLKRRRSPRAAIAIPTPRGRLASEDETG